MGFGSDDKIERHSQFVPRQKRKRHPVLFALSGTLAEVLAGGSLHATVLPLMTYSGIPGDTWDKSRSRSIGSITANCKTTEFQRLAEPRSFPHHILVRKSSMMSKLIYDLAITVEIIENMK